MTKSFDSEHIENLVAGFVVDDLLPEETQEFQELLNENPDLITEVEDLQEVLRQVVDGFVEVEAPAHLLPQILAQVENEQVKNEQAKEVYRPQPSNVSPEILTKRSLWGWKTITGGIAAVLLVIVGIDNYRLRQNVGFLTAENQSLRQDFAQARVVKTMLERDNTKLITFRGVNSKSSASGSIMINPEQEKAVMVFQNLPAPPPNHVYLLWTIVDSEKLPCGKVKPYKWGNAAYELPFTNQMYQEFSHPEFSGLIVTLEKDENVPTPTGTVVLESSQI
ncbi:MAG: anti-sigma factor [Sphaerospermopsis sp. SIO1G1]|nr:anti-sigma factor [Sphaerospermopsis sp. SIO1G1]